MQLDDVFKSDIAAQLLKAAFEIGIERFDPKHLNYR